jgi:hypothetical protein
VTALLCCGVNIFLPSLWAIRFLGSDLCLHCNMLGNLFKFRISFFPPSHLWYAWRNFPSESDRCSLQKLICCSTQVIFWKDFHSICLFSCCSCLIFDGLLTTLCLLDCIVPCLEHAEWCFSYLRFAYQIYSTELTLNISYAIHYTKYRESMVWSSCVIQWPST